MKKLILLSVAASLLSGCAHSTWQSVESTTDLGGIFFAPLVAVNAVAKIGRVSTKNEDPEIIILENGKAVLK